MALPMTQPRIQPIPEATRLRIAIVASLVFHLLVLMAIGLIGLGSPQVAREPEPIEVTLEEAAPKPPPAEPPTVRVEAQPEAPRVPSVMPGGGSPKAPVVRNPSPIKSPKPSSRPASDAGGRAKAAPGAPAILTSKNGKTPAGQVGQGRAPFGPGGKEQVEGGGPTYGPGVGGGPVPIYPKNAMDQGLEGTVTLSVTIGPGGEVESIAVATSSGHDVLDQAAMRAIRKGWKFTPGMAKGKPAAGKVNVTFHFAGGVAKKG